MVGTLFLELQVLSLSSSTELGRFSFLSIFYPKKKAKIFFSWLGAQFRVVIDLEYMTPGKIWLKTSHKRRKTVGDFLKTLAPFFSGTSIRNSGVFSPSLLL